MKVDGKGRLIVAGGGTGLVSVLDARTGSHVRRFSTGFSGAQFLNDLAVGKNGDVYVTDSMRPVLYRIAASELHAAAGTAQLQTWLDFTGTPLQYQPGFNLRLSGDFSKARLLQRTTPPGLKDPTTIAIARGPMLVVNSQFASRPSATLRFTVSSIAVP